MDTEQGSHLTTVPLLEKGGLGMLQQLRIIMGKRSLFLSH
jgi:hypothetical protein